MTEDASALYNFALDADDKQQTFDIDAFIEDFFGFEPDLDTLKQKYARFADTLNEMDIYIASHERQVILEDIYNTEDLDVVDRCVKVGKQIEALIDNQHVGEPLIYFDEDAHKMKPITYQRFIDIVEN